MSRAIASARQKRAGIQPEPVSVPKSQQQTSSSSGLTLPQVIALIDTRLTKLEKFAKDTQEQPVRSAVSTIESGDVGDLNGILEDFNNRFVILAEEIAQLKDTLLKLQSYTMDVNKMLLDERVNVLSDLGEGSTSKTPMYVMNNTTLGDGEVENVETNVFSFSSPPLAS